MAIPERDWKVFRELRLAALDRFCKRVLAEVTGIAGMNELSAHERYLKLYGLIHDRDKELARAFNDPRRSSAVLQLLQIHALGLLTPEELARFSPETQETIDFLSGNETQ